MTDQLDKLVMANQRIAQLQSELAALRETRQKDYEASVAALKATGLYGEHDNDSLSVLGAFDALQLRLTALRKENAGLLLRIDQLNDADRRSHQLCCELAVKIGKEHAHAEQLRADLDEQLAIFNRSRTQWKKGYDALKVNLDAAIKLLREAFRCYPGFAEACDWPTENGPFRERRKDAKALTSEIEKFLKEHALHPSPPLSRLDKV